MASRLKAEWDSSNGKLTRICQLCTSEFKPTSWNQILCDNLCKEGSRLKAHLKASQKRYDNWLAKFNKVKKKEVSK